jgi:hypothetical protein
MLASLPAGALPETATGALRHRIGLRPSPASRMEVRGLPLHPGDRPTEAEAPWSGPARLEREGVLPRVRRVHEESHLVPLLGSRASESGVLIGLRCALAEEGVPAYDGRLMIKEHRYVVAIYFGVPLLGLIIAALLVNGVATCGRAAPKQAESRAPEGR